MRDLTHRESENFALIRRTDVALKSLAVFVHGFFGNYWTTWGGIPHLLFTEADDKPTFKDWDYVFLGYNTRHVRTYLDIAQLIWAQWHKAERGFAPYGHRYERIALFGHSLGTLGLRQVLCATAYQPPKSLQQLHSVTLFGSPLNGSSLAQLPLGVEIRHALTVGNSQLRMLKAWSESVHAYAPWPKVRLILGLDDDVVGSINGELVQWIGDEKMMMTGLDHSALVKANGWDTSVIDYLDAGLR